MGSISEILSQTNIDPPIGKKKPHTHTLVISTVNSKRWSGELSSETCSDTGEFASTSYLGIECH